MPFVSGFVLELDPPLVNGFNYLVNVVEGTYWAIGHWNSQPIYKLLKLPHQLPVYCYYQQAAVCKGWVLTQEYRTTIWCP